MKEHNFNNLFYQLGKGKECWIRIPNELPQKALRCEERKFVIALNPLGQEETYNYEDVDRISVTLASQLTKDFFADPLITVTQPLFNRIVCAQCYS